MNVNRLLVNSSIRIGSAITLYSLHLAIISSILSTSKAICRNPHDSGLDGLCGGLGNDILHE